MAPRADSAPAMADAVSPPGKGDRAFTWKELAKHNTAASAYVAIRGQVYDVTEWGKAHPGGADVLLVAAGRDVTHVFDSYHKESTNALLSKFRVGTLVDKELPTFPEANEFQRTVRKRVDDYFTRAKIDRKHAPWMWARYCFIFGGIGLSWYLQLLLAPVNFAAAAACAVFLGWCCALLGLMPLHDGSHFAITRKPWVWRMLGATHDFLNGSSYLVWLYQHMLGHHTYTNIDGADPDIETALDGDIRRIKASQKWYSRYILQHIYVPLVYVFLGLKTRYQDIMILFVIKKNGAIRVNPPSPYHFAVFWAGKAFFVFYRLIVPAMYLSWSTTLALFLISDAVSSYWLALLFQVNHVAEGVDFPPVDPKTMIVEKDWAELQVTTTLDYSHGSWFWTFASGALNYQSTHHLFPGVNQYYYPAIAPIILQTCREFNVPYLVKDSVVSALAAHVKHLYNFGQAPKKD